MNQFLLHLGFFFTLMIPLCAVLVLGLGAILKRPLVEAHISLLARMMAFTYLGSVLLAVSTWLLSGQSMLKWEIASLVHSGGTRIEFNLLLDHIGAVFLVTTAIVANIIIFFSRRYLHRDPGFRRFFLVLSLFLFGMTLLYCAGSFDFIFAAWEIIGLSSFLLIGFYWHRPAAIMSAKKAYFIYRACDVGLLASALLTHLIWHDPNLFYNLGSGNLLQSWESIPLWQQWTLSLLALLPAIGKSAQFPLSYWLPKAMEGPTPSSAIFYGSISIHAGLFLLMRTSSIWLHTPGFNWLLAAIGIISAVLATLFGRVQASIKGQIGYASIAQVGLMFVELAFGLWDLVLIHFVGNAFLRCFQLLVSSSIIAEQLQMHGALEGKQLQHRWSIESWIPASLRSTLYVFALNEGYSEEIIARFISRPIWRLAKFVNGAVAFRTGAASLSPATVSLKSVSWFPFAAFLLYAYNALLGPVTWVSFVFLLASLLLSLTAFGERRNPMPTLKAACLSHLSIVIALTLNQEGAQHAAIFFIAGFLGSWFLLYDSYSYVFSKRAILPGTKFEGLFAQFPLASMLGLIGILGSIGFPVATTFFAEDMLLEQAVHRGWIFVVALSVIFILNGITLVRMHSRIFFGTRDAEGRDLSLDFTSWRALSRLALFIVINGLGFVFV